LVGGEKHTVVKGETKRTNCRKKKEIKSSREKRRLARKVLYSRKGVGGGEGRRGKRPPLTGKRYKERKKKKLGLKKKKGWKVTGGGC